MIRLLNEEKELSQKEQLDKILKSLCRTVTGKFPAKAKEMLVEEGYSEQEYPRNIILKKTRTFDKTPNNSRAGYEIYSLPFEQDDETIEFIEDVLQELFPKADVVRKYHRVDLPSQPLIGSDATEAFISIMVFAGMIAMEVSAGNFKNRY